MPADCSRIFELIKSTGTALSETAAEDFRRIWETNSFKRKTILTSPGETEKKLYFVMDGIQRVYYFDDQGREATLVLSYPFSFSGVLDSFLLQQPSRYYFETLSASVLLSCSHAAFTEVCAIHPELRAFTEKMKDMVIGGLLERMTELQCFSSEEKFCKLLRRSPQVLRLVPHKYLANYLGIDPSNFSKLVNSVRIE